MVDKDVVTAKLVDLVDRIERARRHCPATPAELVADRDALDLVSFNLMLAVQICADVAAHLIAHAGWSTPRTLAEAFDRLVQHGVTPRATGERLKRAIGLRNVVAHGYARIDADIVHDAAMHGLADLEAFAADVAQFVQSRP